MFGERLIHLDSVRTLFSLIAFLALTVPVTLRAAPPGSDLSEDARISMITVLPGSEVHAIFGHTALRVYDPASGFDAVYNYGTFDFSDPLFVPRFAHGQMDYFLSVHGFHSAVTHYRDRERRPVIVQELALDADEVRRIHERLRMTALPENRVYRYDFFFDNCSTRPRDVIEDVLGSRLHYEEPSSGARTFRELLAPYISGRSFLRAGINLLLGSPADRPATTRETMFLPLDLFDRFETATVSREESHEQLVARTDTVAWVDGYELSDGSPPWATIVTLLLLMAGVGLAGHELRTGKPAPSTPDALLLASAGLIGVLITYIWFVSEHTVTGPNWNLAWAWPTHLVAAYLIQRGKADRQLHHYLAATAVVTTLVALSWFVWPQVFPTAFLPFTILIAVRTAVLWRRYRHVQGREVIR